MEEPGGLPSMGSHRVGHDWSDLAAAAAAAAAAVSQSHERIEKMGRQVLKFWLFFSPKSRTLKVINSPNKGLVIKLLTTQLCSTLCDLIDCSPPASSISQNSPGKNTGVSSHSLLRRVFQVRYWSRVSCIAGRFFTTWATREAPCN